MTLNERCAKCLGWEVVVSNNGYSTYYWPDGKVVLDPPQNLTTMMVDRFHPDTDRNHSQLMVDAVKEAGEVKSLLFAAALVHIMPFDGDRCQVCVMTLFLTPAQISEAACKVLEQ